MNWKSLSGYIPFNRHISQTVLCLLYYSRGPLLRLCLWQKERLFRAPAPHQVLPQMMSLLDLAAASAAVPRGRSREGLSWLPSGGPKTPQATHWTLVSKTVLPVLQREHSRKRKKNCFWAFLHTGDSYKLYMSWAGAVSWNSWWVELKYFAWAGWPT